MREMPRVTPLVVGVAFIVGVVFHFLYQRWTGSELEGPPYAVSFSPLPAPAPKPTEIPVVQAREVEKLKGVAGTQARVRGRVFRVGHAAKSNTYFLNFGPSRASFTAVIFASAVDLFEKRGIRPKNYEGRELELTGEVKDHPKYGLEMVLEEPSQVRVVD